MNKYNLVLIFGMLLCNTIAVAQSLYNKGYIVDNEGKKIECEIN